MTPSPLSRERKLLSILASLTLAAGLSACVTRPVAVQLASGCSGLVPPVLTDGVAAPDLPANDTVGEWVAFGDAAVGRLDTANRNTQAAVEIVRRCEARDQKAAERLTRPWWKVWG